jgi:hypothetical protein
MFICLYAGGACAWVGWGGGVAKLVYTSGLSPRLGKPTCFYTHYSGKASVLGQLGASSLLTMEGDIDIEPLAVSTLTRSSRLAVLRIHDILVWIRIRIRGSMPLTIGSGSRKNLFKKKVSCILFFESTFT